MRTSALAAPIMALALAHDAAAFLAPTPAHSLGAHRAAFAVSQHGLRPMKPRTAAARFAPSMALAPQEGKKKWVDRLKSVFLSVLLLPAMLFFFPADALAGQSKGRSGGRMGGGGFAPKPSAPISRSYGGSQVSRPMTSSPGAATAGASTAAKPASSTTAPTSAASSTSSPTAAASTTAAAAPGAASHAAAPHAPHAAAPAAAAPHHSGWRPFGGFGMGLGLGMGMSMMNPFGGFGMGMMSPFGMFGYRPMFFGPSLGTIVMGVGLGLLIFTMMNNNNRRNDYY